MPEKTHAFLRGERDPDRLSIRFRHRRRRHEQHQHDYRQQPAGDAFEFLLCSQSNLSLFVIEISLVLVKNTN